MSPDDGGKEDLERYEKIARYGSYVIIGIEVISFLVLICLFKQIKITIAIL